MTTRMTGLEKELDQLIVDSGWRNLLGKCTSTDIPEMAGSAENSMKSDPEKVQPPRLMLTELIQLWLASQNSETHPILKLFHDEAYTSAEQKFLEKATLVIEEHLSDPEFNTEALAVEVAVSRSQLFRKFVALTGNAPCEYIRIVRLLRAVRLIEQEYGNITEIALAVGFNSPAYFTRCFRIHFGVSPSQYAKNFGRS